MSLPVQWEAFTTNRMLRNPALNMLLPLLLQMQFNSKVVSDYDFLSLIRHKHMQPLLISNMFGWFAESMPVFIISPTHVSSTFFPFYNDVPLAGSPMTINLRIRFHLLAPLLTALCVKPRQPSVAYLILSFLLCPCRDTLFLCLERSKRIIQK